MKYTYIILVSILLISCEDFFETTLDLEEPVFEEKLVVNSLLTNLTLNESRALVSKTIGLNEPEENSLVSDAEVKIIYPDNSEYLLEYSSNANLYLGYNHEGQISELIAEQEYQIHVTSEGKSVTAKATMPNSAKLLSAVYMENGGLNEDGDEVSAIDIIIDDAPDEINYYKIGAVINDDGYTQELYLDSNNAFAIESATYSDILIKDEQFNGEEFKLRLQFNDYFNYGSEPSFEYQVIVKSISKEQYDHDRMLYGYFENNDNPFASPVQLSSNIEGGLGLFAIENIAIFEVEQ
jgi:hypothetical protein